MNSSNPISIDLLQCKGFQVTATDYLFYGIYVHVIQTIYVTLGS